MLKFDGIYVQVDHKDPPWYGHIKGEPKGGMFTVIFGGTKDKEIEVPADAIRIHPAWSWNGLLPKALQGKGIAQKTPPEDVYHVTTLSNLKSIANKGLIPRLAAKERSFKGLDALRGETDEADDRKIAETMKTAAEMAGSGYEGAMEKMLIDRLLGYKGDFVYATQWPKRLCEYAAKILAGKHEAIVLKISSSSFKWFTDLEDDAAIKTFSSIPPAKIKAAKYGEDLDAITAQKSKERLDALTWKPCTTDPSLL